MNYPKQQPAFAKLYSTIACFILSANLLNAQIDNTSPKGRNSISVFFVSYNAGDPIATSIYKKYNIPQRFDINDIGIKTLDVNAAFEEQTGIDTDILSEIRKQRIPNNILRSVLINEQLGYMTPQVLEDRGLYSATDADVITANNAEMGLAILKSRGPEMLNNIYFAVVQPTNYSYSKEDKYSQITTYGFSGTTHLYKIKLADVTGSLSQFWLDFYFDKPNSQMMTKLMDHEFDITQVYAYPFSVTGTNLGAAGGFLTGLQLASNLSLGIKTGINTDNVVYKDEKEVQTTLLEKAMNASFESFEKLLGGFTVAQNIFSAKPLQAKIGKKESVKPDDLFEVTEKVLNPKTGSVSIEHVGYIRAKKVVNNSYKSSGKSTPSTFYRVASGKIRKGMELTKMNEGKWTVGASYNVGDNSLLGNYVINSEYITHWWAGMRVGLDVGYINDIKTTSVSFSGTKQKGSVEGGVGLTGVLSFKPSINFHRLSIIPVAGVYYSYIPLLSSTLENQLTTKYPNIYATELGGVAGVDVGINLTRTLQIHAGYRKTYSLYNITKDDNDAFPYELKFGDNTIMVGIRLFRL